MSVLTGTMTITNGTRVISVNMKVEMVSCAKIPKKLPICAKKFHRYVWLSKVNEMTFLRNWVSAQESNHFERSQ